MDSCLNNSPKQHIIRAEISWLFHSVSATSLLKFFQLKLQAVLHFRPHKYGSRQLFRYIYIFVSLTSLLWCCSFVEHQKSFKSQSWYLWRVPHLLLGLEKKPTFEPKLTSAEAYCRIFCTHSFCRTVSINQFTMLIMLSNGYLATAAEPPKWCLLYLSNRY